MTNQIEAGRHSYHSNLQNHDASVPRHYLDNDIALPSESGRIFIFRQFKSANNLLGTKEPGQIDLP